MSRDLYIVDDNADHQFLMYKLLKDTAASYPIKFFDTGQALFRHVKMLAQNGQAESLPSLIISDLNMPGMNGLGLIKQFRQLSGANEIPMQYIPIVIMSSDITLTQINQCYNAGANAVIIKPFDFNEMKNTIHSICKFWINDHINGGV
ncbi:response regulator [Dyadobacter subterraneus]|uniref:Response regulator n=1 Tax=Dyadobacter subterraneus TaxID=2773304 RepID=A0ABR9WF02_9BACT|nr:response regulator [Dyadobacter subterraneus]MBE9464005.1 response regulator [Dyadobacter subterraneus]